MADRDEWRWTDAQGAERVLGTAELRAALASGAIPPSALVRRASGGAAAAASTFAELGPHESPSSPGSGDPPLNRKLAHTLTGIAIPRDDATNTGAGTQAPIVVPTAGDAPEVGRAIITQLPRFTPLPGTMPSGIAIPPAPRLPGGDEGRADPPISTLPRLRSASAEIDDMWNEGSEDAKTAVRAPLHEPPDAGARAKPLPAAGAPAAPFPKPTTARPPPPKPRAVSASASASASGLRPALQSQPEATGSLATSAARSVPPPPPPRGSARSVPPPPKRGDTLSGIGRVSLGTTSTLGGTSGTSGTSKRPAAPPPPSRPIGSSRPVPTEGSPASGPTPLGTAQAASRRERSKTSEVPVFASFALGHRPETPDPNESSNTFRMVPAPASAAAPGAPRTLELDDNTEVHPAPVRPEPVTVPLPAEAPAAPTPTPSSATTSIAGTAVAPVTPVTQVEGAKPEAAAANVTLVGATSPTPAPARPVTAALEADAQRARDAAAFETPTTTRLEEQELKTAPMQSPFVTELVEAERAKLGAPDANAAESTKDANARTTSTAKLPLVDAVSAGASLATEEGGTTQPLALPGADVEKRDDAREPDAKPSGGLASGVHARSSSLRPPGGTSERLPLALSREALRTPFVVPLSSLLAAGGAIIAMALVAFFVGRVSGASTTRAVRGVRVAVAVRAPAQRAVEVPRACYPVKNPQKWATGVAQRVPFQMVATERGTLAIGFATAKREAVALEVDLAKGAVEERKREPSEADIERVNVLPGDPAWLSVLPKEGALKAPVLVPFAASPWVFGEAEGALAGAPSASPSDTPASIWSDPADKPMDASAVMVAGDKAAIVLRRGGAIWGGWVTPDRKALAPIVKITGSGGSVGKPELGLNGAEVAVVFADQAGEGKPWEIRLGHAPVGSMPDATSVFALPAGGPGGDVFAPDITGLKGGRWLVIWTEGPPGSRAVRALTLAPDLTPLGDALALSPPAGNFGQGVLSVVEAAGLSYVAAVFLSKGDEGYELWGGVLQCG